MALRPLLDTWYCSWVQRPELKRSAKEEDVASGVPGWHLQLVWGYFALFEWPCYWAWVSQIRRSWPMLCQEHWGVDQQVQWSGREEQRSPGCWLCLTLSKRRQWDVVLFTFLVMQVTRRATRTFSDTSTSWDLQDRRPERANCGLRDWPGLTRTLSQSPMPSLSHAGQRLRPPRLGTRGKFHWSGRS